MGKRKSFISKKSEELQAQYDMSGLVDDYYGLGMSSAFGYVLFALDEEYTNKELRELIRDILGTNEKLMADAYAIAYDVHKNTRDGN